MSDLNITVENLENQLDHHEQYLQRNCMSTNGITETQCKNTDDISICILNQHLKLKLTENEINQNHMIGNVKSGIKEQDLLLTNLYGTLQPQTKKICE